MPFKHLIRLSICAFLATAAVHGWAAEEEPEMSPEAAQTEHDADLFRDDPAYEDKDYNIDDQLEIYGGKRAVTTPRPLIEFGIRQYEPGPFLEDSNILGDSLFGELNPTHNAIAVYGDWKTAAAYNDNGAVEKGVIATQLNLDIDFRLTGTERLHAFIQPLNKGGNFTRCEFAADGNDDCDLELDFNLDTLFFEGDLGAIYAGLSGEYNTFDLPFAVGLMPLVVQNGVWIEDAFTGVAATLPALNSRRFDISNMDITAFAGFDKVSSKGVLDINGNVADAGVNLYGINAFIEANRGYWEVGYAFTDGRDELDDQDFHNFTIAHSRRFRDLLSNSLRFIWNFGQDRDAGRQNADGFVILVENSFITSRPTTLVPYLNLFAGFDRPQSLARAGAAGGILKNTGINFETDNLTGFPKLDDTANNTYGGALGVQYLFNLDQQLVVELATVQPMGNARNRFAAGEEYAIGMRYQLPLTKAWIFRADAMAADREDNDSLFGARVEIRRKF